MEHQTDLAAYRSWLTHREYSPATIQKYTKALARFFSDTGAGKIPDRETVAAWRDDLAGQGYSPATVNGLIAAVNMYQESINPLTINGKPEILIYKKSRPRQTGVATSLSRCIVKYSIACPAGSCKCFFHHKQLFQEKLRLMPA